MNKKNFNIFKKIMLLLIILVVYIAIPSKVYALDEITISFETYGGTSVNDITINANEEIGALPTSTMHGYILDGWYKDEMYENKVSPKSKFDSDTTLYARWESVYFPYIFKRDEVNCNGSYYIDTNRKLYTQTNNDYLLDYEVGFTIDEYNPTGQAKQAVFFNAKWENTSKKWPGIVFRRMDATNGLEITQSINMGNKESHVIDNYTLPLEVKIYRIDHVIYYSLNGGEMIELQDMEDFNSYFDTNAFFCAGDNGSGGAQRYVKSKLSNVYIKMGSYEETTYNSVTYPDGTVELIEYNTFANVGTNNVDKADRDISLTFKQHNGEEDIVKTMHKSYTKNGFIVRGSEDVHYDDEGEIFVNEDKVIEYYYDEDIEEAEFPEDPEKDHYTFNGWYTEETGGEEITSYTGENDIEIHAQYTGEDVTIHTPTGDRTVHYGDNYNLGTNTITKANDNYSEVTFKLHNNQSDIIRHVEKVYTPNGWTISNTHYDDNESITITEEITIEPDYTESITGVEFPSDSVKEGYDFTGWYTEETGGDAISSYDGENDIEIHAQYEVHIPVITTPYGTYNPDENGNFTLETNSREKWPEVITSVSFVRNNGQRTYSEDLKYTYTTNGWLIEGTHYDDGEVIHVTKDITVEPDYIKTLVLPPFPPNPVKEGYTFVGWFDANSGGNQYTTYDNVDGPRYISLYARYRSNTSYGDYRLPRNETQKANTTRSTVTFVYHNGTADTTSTVETRYYPNGWLVDGVHHEDGDFIFKTDETVIEPDYNSYPVNGAFPTNPTKSGYQFVGWFTEETGGEPVTVLRGDSDITVHAHYTDNYAITKERSSFGYTFTDAVYDNSIDQRDINILPGTVEQYNEAVAGGEAVIKNLESTTSPNPIYVWQSGENVYYYSPADVIFLPTNGSSIFYLVRFNTIDMSGFNTVKVTNMSQMFLYSYADLDVSSFDTHNVTNMSDMFSYSNPHTSLDLRHFDTSKVRNMNSMFFGVYTSGEIDVSSFDTRNVTDLAGFFNTAFDYKTNITRSYNLNHFDTSKVTNLNAAFNICGLKHIDVDEWDTSNVTQMNSIFNNDTLFEELDLTNWDTHNVTTARSIFNTCYATTIYVSRDKWDMSQLQSDGTTNSSDYNMTNNMKNVVGQYGTKYNANNVKDKTYAVIDDAPETPGYLTDSYPDYYAVKVLDDLEIVQKKTQYTLPNNTEESETPDEILSTVTFKYFNGSEDTTSTVINTNMPSGWIIDGVHYDDGAKLTVTDDIEATPDFIEVVMGAEFPEDPTKTGYRFLGWYTEETGGERITSYNDSEDITLYAHWELDLNPGEYELPVNDIDKDSDIYTVTFINNDEEYSTSNVVVSYIPNGWLVDGEHYDVGETITYTDGMVIEPDYTKNITSAIFPDNPSRAGSNFSGWFDNKTGGNKYTSYNEERDISLYSHFYVKEDAEEYILPINDIPKESEEVSTVIFKFHNGDPDYVSHVIKRYIPNGWLVDGVRYNANERIYKDENTVIEPNYNFYYVMDEYPDNPTLDGYKFKGWYTEETDGELVTDYHGLEDKVLHAQYTNNYAILIPGPEVYDLFRQGVTIQGWSNWGSFFEKGTREGYESAQRGGYYDRFQFKISTEDSPNDVYIYATHENNWDQTYYYTDADVIFFNPDSSKFFSGFEGSYMNLSQFSTVDVENMSDMFSGSTNSSINNIDLSNFDTRNVTNMSRMFSGLYGIKHLDLSGFSTSKVTNMSYMLSLKNVETLDLSSFDTSNVTNMSGMFSNLEKLKELNINNFDTSNVTDMSRMFYSAYAFTDLDLSVLNTSKVTDMSSMFYSMRYLKNIKLGNFDTSNVTNMSQMFNYLYAIEELDISSFDTSNVTNANYMFSGSNILKTVRVSDKWTNENIESSISMFRNASKLVGQKGTTYDSSHTDKTYGIVDDAPDHPGYLTYKYKDLYTLTFPDYSDETEAGDYNLPANTIQKQKEELKDITFKLHNGEEDIVKPIYIEYTPNGWTENDIHYDDTVNVERDMTFTPDYIEVNTFEFPEDPTWNDIEFLGWYTEDGDKVESIDDIGDNTVLHAHWDTSIPTDMTIDSEDIEIVVGETHQIGVTFIPEGSTDTLTYNDFDKDVISLTEEGLITGLEVGETTITVGTENTDIEKTINVTVIGDKITSKVLSVEDRTKARIIIGENPETNINDFLDKIDNPKRYLEVYDKDDNLISSDDYDSTIVTTGMKVKLVIGNTEYDEVIVIIRGDIDQDGYVDISDSVTQLNHILYIELIDDYRLYAADIDIDEEAEEDEMIDISDNVKLDKFILGEIDNINE